MLFTCIGLCRVLTMLKSIDGFRPISPPNPLFFSRHHHFPSHPPSLLDQSELSLPFSASFLIDSHSIIAFSLILHPFPDFSKSSLILGRFVADPCFSSHPPSIFGHIQPFKASFLVDLRPIIAFFSSTHHHWPSSSMQLLPVIKVFQSPDLVLPSI